MQIPFHLALGKKLFNKPLFHYLFSLPSFLHWVEPSHSIAKVNTRFIFL